MKLSAPIEYQYRRRAGDGKIEKVGRFKDYDQSYTYHNEYGSELVLVPDVWICVEVLDNGPLTSERIAGYTG